MILRTSLALVAVLLLVPSAQAWSLQVTYGGPYEEYVEPLLHKVCIPDVHTDTNPPFVDPDLTCLSQWPFSELPIGEEEQAASEGNETTSGGP